MLSRIASLTARRALTPTVFYASRATAATDAVTAAAAGGNACPVKPSGTPPSALKIQEGPERDLVNFPRRPRPINPDKVRMGFVPVEWMDFFYSKTGVTGPFLWFTGFTTYVVSKEIYVLEHDFYHGIGMCVFIYGMMKLVGPQLAAYLDKEIDDGEDSLNNIRSANYNSVNDLIALEGTLQEQARSQIMLFEAKRENVALQLEAAYRQRLVQIYTEVKRRLDYQVELLNAARRIEQQHMVKWIVDNVVKSITPQQEKEAIQHCIGNLKSLAATV